MPLLLGKDGRKLSKRRNPTSTFYFKDTGYLPEALNNFLTLMGYSMQDDKEIYSLQEFFDNFDVKRIGKSGAYFDIKKLDWVNQQYLINNFSEKDILQRLKDWQFNDEFFKKLIPLGHTRMKNFSEFMELFDFMFISNLNYTTELLCPKKTTSQQSALILYAMMALMEKYEKIEPQNIEEASHMLSELFQINHKKIVMPILFGAIQGKKFGPPLFQSAPILGKDRLRARFLNAINFLGEIPNKKIKRLKELMDLGNCSEFMKETD
jgi:glutamyl-tRNA synthetase